MRNPLTSPGATNLGLLLARVPLGAWLVLSGFSKFSASGGVERFVKQFAAALPAWVPAAVGGPFLRVVPYAEILLGAALVLGVAGRFSGLLASALLGGLLLGVTGTKAAGGPFHPDVALLGVALLVFLAGPGAISMDRFMWGRASQPLGDSIVGGGGGGGGALAAARR